MKLDWMSPALFDAFSKGPSQLELCVTSCKKPMSLNNSNPESPLNPAAPQNPSANPDYAELVRFLIGPFLESPEALRVDCERSSAQRKVWIRLAFEAEDKGRVYGRWGHNIQAIRTVLSTIAGVAGESVYLDIYEDSPPQSRPRAAANRPSPKRPTRSRRSSPPRRLARRDGQ
jgi:predicted RNA-binding protein YlqC (UPF0109 family)